MKRIHKRVRIHHLKEKKKNQEKILCLTAYDYTFARILDSCDLDLILVGDTLAQVSLGYQSTLPVTLEEMIHHSKAVRRGVERSFLVADLPFLSYQVSIEDCIKNAGRMMKEAGVEGVKLEGGAKVAEKIQRLTEAGIPVLGHLGYTPQSEHQLGGPSVQGRKDSKRLLNDAKIIQESGAFAIVLEMIPMNLAQEISESLEIPTIGIGAGPHCDGQILVCYDFLGLTPDFQARFVKAYASFKNQIEDGVKQFKKEVEQGQFPSQKESYS